MKANIYLKKSLGVLALSISSMAISSNAVAQDQVGQMMKAGVADAGKLVDAYMSPLMKGFGAGLNGGWYNTAKPHGLGRFDLTLSFNAAFVPDEDKIFNAANLGFSQLRIKAGTGPNAATVSGEESLAGNAVYELYAANPVAGGPDILVTEFASPQGTGLPYSGAPTAQLAVGLVKNTEVMVRYMPTISLGESGDVGLFGFGVKHDIKQWIPVVDKLPFDLSAYFGYTKFNLDKSIELAPESGKPNKTGNTITDFSNQSLNVETKATTFGLLLSKKVAILTVYSGLNYQTSTSTLAMNGNYPITELEARAGDPNFGNEVINGYANPLKFDVEGANGFTGTLGARLKLLIFTLNGAYTFGQYPYASLGLGINVDLK
jgi:hypothetical protein